MLSERYFPQPGDVGQTRTRYIVQGQRGYQVELANDASGWSNATYRHEIGDVSVVLRAVTGQATTRDVAYKTTDRLGSPLGILDKTGQFRQRSESGAMNNTNTQLNFSPFGAAREPTFQPRATTGEMPGRLNLTPSTRLGFTGHEHLDSLGLIHMNGRVYDHRLGRFLSVDPFIQFPANSQSLNPYSYIMNNPMAGTDPSGYKARLNRHFRALEECGSNPSCESDGPVKSFRNSLSYGGAPKDTWNGQESASIIPKVNEVLGKAGKIVGTVTVGEPFMLAQAGTMPRDVYEEFLDDESPRARAERTGEAGKAIGDAGHDLAEPSWWDVFPVSKVRKANRVKEAADKVRDATRGRRLADEACCCFPAGTLVWAEDGAVPIEDIKVGQRVHSRNPQTGETALKPVTALIATKPKTLFEVAVRGRDGTLEYMRVTGDHPYWVKGKGWLTADKLQAGMILSDFDNAELQLDEVSLTGAVVPTYNFTVEDFQTYFAGKSKVFVHNCSCFAPEVLEAAKRVGVKMEDAKIVDGTATMKINFSATLEWNDVELIKGAMRDRGASRLHVESGFIGNDKLEDFLNRRVSDGKPFQGGTVRRSDATDSDFVIDFNL